MGANEIEGRVEHCYLYDTSYIWAGIRGEIGNYLLQAPFFTQRTLFLGQFFFSQISGLRIRNLP